MKNKLIAVVLLLLVLLLGWLFLFSKENPINVNLATVSKGRVDLTVSNTRAGSVKACQRSRLSLPVGGQIADLLVSEGDQVKEGQLLIRLWNKDQRARLVDARSRLVVAKLAVLESCRLAALNKREYARLAALAVQKLVSAERLDASNTQMSISAASCEKSRASAQSVEASVSVQAAIVEKTELIAPFSGVIAEVNGEVGEYITPSPPGVATPPAVDLIDEQCVYISAPVDEVDAAQIQTGMAATVSLDAFRGESFTAEVTRIAPYVKALEKQARTVDIELILLDEVKQKKLLIGYSADIDVIIKQHTNTLRLPTETVIDGRNVLLYDPSTGRLRRKEFTPGISNWRFTEVRSGLSEGDQVLRSLDEDGAVDGARVVVDQ